VTTQFLPKSETTVLKSLAEQPADQTAWADLSASLERAGRPFAAAAAAQVAAGFGLAGEHPFPALFASLFGKTWDAEALATAYLSCGRGEAEILSRAWIKAGSGTARMVLAAAEDLERQNQTKAAYRVVSDLMTIDPHVRGAAEVLGRLAWAAGDVEGALDAMALSVAEKPKDLSRLEELAVLLCRLGRWPEAVVWLRRWTDIQPRDVRPRELLDTALSRRGEVMALGGTDSRLADSIRRIPMLAAVPVADTHVSALSGGHLNVVHRVDLPGRSLAVRLGKYPRQRWDGYWVERHNMRLAAGQGLAPDVLFMDIADGTLATEYVDGSCEGRMGDPKFLDAVADFFAYLHQGPDFMGRHDPLEALDWREERIAGFAPDWVPDLEDLRRRMGEVRDALARTAPAFAPCHNDPIIGNFLDQDGRLVMIDWQTAAMADPDGEAGSFLARISRQGSLREGFLRRLYADPWGRRACRARLWEVLARYIEVVEAVQMGQDMPEDKGWVLHGTQALDSVRALLDDGTVARGILTLKGQE
jgi:tetratricopeptide (TPR) repeat protein